jgi:hypothetical protein
MFPTLQLEVLDRFTAVDAHFRASPKGKATVPSQVAKGLVFVEIYAIYEYTVRESMRLAIEAIASHAPTYERLSPSLLAVFLDPQLRSIRDCGPSNIWERRLELFERSFSSQPVSVVAALPSDGEHFRHSQLSLILKTLGVRRKATRRIRHLYAIDEVVNHRNMIAHGSSTAEEIGRRYSRSEVFHKMRLMQRICLRIIAIVSEHCMRPDRHCR